MGPWQEAKIMPADAGLHALRRRVERKGHSTPHQQRHISKPVPWYVRTKRGYRSTSTAWTGTGGRNQIDMAAKERNRRGYAHRQAQTELAQRQRALEALQQHSSGPVGII